MLRSVRLSVRQSVCLSVCTSRAPSSTTVHLGLWLLQHANRKLPMLEVKPTGQRGLRKWPKRQRSRRRRRFRSIRQMAQPVRLMAAFGSVDWASGDIRQQLCGLRTCSTRTAGLLTPLSKCAGGHIVSPSLERYLVFTQAVWA